MFNLCLFSRRICLMSFWMRTSSKMHASIWLNTWRSTGAPLTCRATLLLTPYWSRVWWPRPLPSLAYRWVCLHVFEEHENTVLMLLKLLSRNPVLNTLYVVAVFTSSSSQILTPLFWLSPVVFVCPLTHPCLTFLQFSETQELIEWSLTKWGE